MTFIVFFRRSASGALLTLGATVLALTTAFFLSGALQEGVADALIGPAVERRAGNDLADLFSAPHKDSGMETVHGLDLERMIRERPAPFVELVERFGADIDEVAARVRTGGYAGSGVDGHHRRLWASVVQGDGVSAAVSPDGGAVSSHRQGGGGKPAAAAPQARSGQGGWFPPCAAPRPALS